MQPNYLDERLPRYTSYPTAPHFSTAVGASDYRRWLAELPAELDVSLYVHVPFCRSMCWYCGCHTTVALRDGPIEAYLASLRREIEAVAALPAWPLHVRHLHFGGGTPTILRPEDFAGHHLQIHGLVGTHGTERLGNAAHFDEGDGGFGFHDRGQTRLSDGSQRSPPLVGRPEGETSEISPKSACFRRRRHGSCLP